MNDWGDERDELEEQQVVSLAHARAVRAQQRRDEAVALRIAGLSVPQIASRLGIEKGAVSILLESALRETPTAAVNELRVVENQRLDRAQAAIWNRVIDGDLAAIDTYLRISHRRSALNGLDAPKQIMISANVRMEMEQALKQLEEVVLHAEVIRDEEDDDDAAELG